VHRSDGYPTVETYDFIGQHRLAARADKRDRRSYVPRCFAAGNRKDCRTFYGRAANAAAMSMENRPMPENASQMELDERIALLRRNISELMEQATGASGAAVEEALANRLSEQQDILNELLKKREAMG